MDELDGIWFPGVRDFDQGVKNLSRLASEANFPFLASNLEGVDGIEDYKIIDANGVKIGLIGLITPFISEGLLPEYYEGVAVSDIKKTLNEYKILKLNFKTRCASKFATQFSV